MTRNELLARLQPIEWSDIEFKETGIKLKSLHEQQKADAQQGGEDNGH